MIRRRRFVAGAPSEIFLQQLSRRDTHIRGGEKSKGEAGKVVRGRRAGGWQEPRWVMASWIAFGDIFKGIMTSASSTGTNVSRNTRISRTRRSRTTGTRTSTIARRVSSRMNVVGSRMTRRVASEALSTILCTLALQVTVIGGGAAVAGSYVLGPSNGW